jgi:hypothetical protein
VMWDRPRMKRGFAWLPESAAKHPYWLRCLDGDRAGLAVFDNEAPQCRQLGA